MYVNLENLVRFYDEQADARPHSNAIKTVAGEELNLALLCHYMRTQLNVLAQALDGSCTSAGKRLDKWIRVEGTNDGVIYYQVEVKSWSFHGFGGGDALELEVSGEQLRSAKRTEWESYWDQSKLCFREQKLNKVLTRMRQYPNERVRPLACLWAAMHPSGDDEPFFRVPCVSKDFDQVWIFSTSAYARQLIARRTKEIALELPMTQARVRYFEQLFPLKRMAR